MFIRILGLLLLCNYTSISHAANPCDKLAALEADPLSTSKSVDFSDLNAKLVISKCTEAISISDNKVDEARFILQRARGYFRAGEAGSAINDLLAAYALGYPAAYFGLATAYLLGEGMDKDVFRAEILFLESYYQGVVWSARGLALLYGEVGSDLYNREKSILWENKFNEENN